MRTLRRIIARLALGTIGLAIIVALLLVIVTHSDRFRDWLRLQIIATVDPLFPGRLTIGRIEGSIWGTLVLRDVSLRDATGDVAHVTRIAASYTVYPLLRGRLPTLAVEIDALRVRAVQDAEGRWNVVEAFRPEPVQGEGGAGLPGWFSLMIDPITLRDGSVSMTLASDPGRTYAVNDVTVTATVTVEPTGFRATIEELAASMTPADVVPALQLQAALTYDDRVAPAVIDVSALALVTAHSQVRLRGRLENLEAPSIDTQAELVLGAADIHALAPAVALRDDVTGSITLRGSLADLHTTLRLTAGGATVAGDAHVDVGGAELRYQAAATLENIEPAAALTAEVPGGVIDGKVEASGVGTTLAAVDGRAELGISGLAWEGRAFGDATLSVRLADGRASVVAAASGGPAGVKLTGAATLTEPLRYEAMASIRELDPAMLPGGNARLRGALNLDVSIAGTGVNLDDMEGRATVDVHRSSIGPVTLDGGHIEAALANARVRIAQMQVRAAAARLEASGDVGLGPDAPGTLRYDLNISDLTPWLTLVGQDGAGSVTLHGQASGNLRDLRLSGQLAAEDLRGAGVSAKHATVEYELAQAGSAFPGGTVAISVREASTGIDLQDIEARVALDAGPPAVIDVTATAHDGQRRAQRVAAHVSLGATETTVQLTQLSIETPRGQWRLAQPAQVVQNENGVRLEELRLESGAQYLVAAGRLSPVLDLDVRAAGVDLAALNAVPNAYVTDVTGHLDATLTIHGPTAQPIAGGEMHVAGVSLRVRPTGVTITDGALDLVLEGDVIRLTGLSAKAQDGTVSASGAIEMRDYRPQDMAITLRAERWPLFDTQRYKATIAAMLTCEGSVIAPIVRGRVDVLNASLRPDLDFLNRQAVSRDETIEVVGRTAAAGGQADTATAADSETQPIPDIYRDLVLDVAVGIQRDAWVRHPDAATELSGELRVHKAQGAETTLVGRIETIRGWVAFRGRRFQLQRGEIRFTGGAPIDPSLDIVAAHQFPEYLVEIVIGGTARVPSLTLRSDPRLEQADILALLLFGKPVGQLAQGEKESLQQQALSVAGSYAAQELGQSVSEALGLDHLGIDIRQLDFEGGSMGLGTYVTEKTYVSIDQAVTGTRGTKATIEYFFTPNWEAQTSTTSAGDSEVGVLWRKRY